ncbi:MAG: hypothetical protein ABFC57_12805 [Veillonellales bacterium]
MITNYTKLGKLALPVYQEWANISGEYKRSRSDYMELCPSCHRLFDKGNYCKHGHEYTKENTYYRKEGWRCCKKCRKIASKRWYQNHAKAN